MFRNLHKKISLILAAIIFSSAVFMSMPVMPKADTGILNVKDISSLADALNDESSTKLILLENDIEVQTDEYKEVMYTVKGSHTLDLNGKTINVINSANIKGNSNDSTLFYLESGAELTVTDSSDNGKGTIRYQGGIYPILGKYGDEPFSKVASRDIFGIDDGAVLNINSGHFIAGNAEKQYLGDAIYALDDAFEYSSAMATQVVCGTVVNVYQGGKLNVNSGELVANGRSRGAAAPNIKGWDIERPASVCIRSEGYSEVTVNDGVFIGDNGADIFALSYKGTNEVKSGSFLNKCVKDERTVDYEGFKGFIKGEYYGKINLHMKDVPKDAYSCFYREQTKLDSFSYSGTLDNSEGKICYLRPDTAYSFNIKASGFTGYYPIGAEASLEAKYERYFKGSTVTYKWFCICDDGTKVEFDNNSSVLSLSDIPSNTLKLKKDKNYEFGCIVTEKYSGTQEYLLTTPSVIYNMTTTDENVISSITINVSKVNSDGKFNIGSAPAMSVSSKSGYKLKSVSWYSSANSENLGKSPKLEGNTFYNIVLQLEAKGDYIFSSESRVTKFNDAVNPVVIPSSDGKSATVTATVFTSCAHSAYRFEKTDNGHSALCSTCGKVMYHEAHSYSSWKSLDGIMYYRSCDKCPMSENLLGSIYNEEQNEVLRSVKLGIETPMADASASKPSIYDIPDKSDISIISYSWTKEDGSHLTAFEEGKNCVLTVVLKTKNENTVFSPETSFDLNYPCSASVVLSDDMRSATVTYTLRSVADLNTNVSLPYVSSGSYLRSVIPSVGMSKVLITWTKDGKIIGKYTVENGGISNIIDLNPSDDIDFENEKFKIGSTYSMTAAWDLSYTGIYVKLDNIGTGNSDCYEVQEGMAGYISAFYTFMPESSVIITPGITGVTEPQSGELPSSYATTKGTRYTVSNITWLCNGQSVTKFKCGEQYTLVVTLKAQSGFSFAKEGCVPSVNGVKADYTFSGDNLVISYTFPPASHDLDTSNIVCERPNCKSAGKVSISCGECDFGADIVLDKIYHKLTKVEALAPNCQSEGMAEYSYCYDCNAYIVDTNGTETTKDALVLPVTEHTEYVGYCYNDTHHYKMCSTCAVLMSEEEYHKYESQNQTEDGKFYGECECGYYSVSSEPIRDPSKDNSGGLSMKKIKNLMIAAIVFFALIIFSIIGIFVYLLATRKSYRKLLLEAEKYEEKLTEHKEEVSDEAVFDEAAANEPEDDVPLDEEDWNIEEIVWIKEEPQITEFPEEIPNSEEEQIPEVEPKTEETEPKKASKKQRKKQR